MIRRVSPSNYFYLCNGNVIKTKTGLVRELKEMDDGTFGHHVNSERNDFANWVNDVFEDHELGEKIFKTNNKDEMVSVIEKSMKKSLARKSKPKKKDTLTKLKEAFLHG